MNYAYTQRFAVGQWNSTIFMHKNSGGSAQDADVLSHEMGHAWHNWADVYLLNESYASYKNEFNRFWSSQVALNGVAYNSSSPSYPWSTSNIPSESVAGAFRFHLGAVGSAGTVQSPADGLKNPADNPAWKKQLNLLGKTVKVWENSGLLAGSLTWQNGADGYFQFQINTGQWVAHLNHAEFFLWNGTNWNPWTPPGDQNPH